MLTAAIIVGLLGYYYFGPKIGVAVGVSIFGLNALALVRPSYALAAYGCAAAITFGVTYMGPRMSEGKLDVFALAKKMWKQGRKLYKTFKKKR